MRLYTNSNLQEIQSGFSKGFPGLKLDFIFHGDEKLNVSFHFHHSFLFIPVEELCPACAGDDIVIDESMTTKEVEALFESHWHLPAMVYAEIGGYWQRNNKTECIRLKEYKYPAISVSKEGSLAYQNLQ